MLLDKMTQIIERKQVISFVMLKKMHQLFYSCLFHNVSLEKKKCSITNHNNLFSVSNEPLRFTFQTVNASDNCPEKRCFSGRFYFELPTN